MASRSLGTLTLDLIARIGGFEQSMDRASRSVSRTASVASASSREVLTLQNSFRSLASVAASIAGPLAAALSVKGVYDMTEAYGTLTNRLKLVTSSSAELVAAQSAVFNIAQASAQPLASTAELYQRIATNQEALKLSGEGVAGVVGTISKTLAVSGASAESANAALIQLGQAFASGVLRGEELNSVMEQAPALAQAIAAGMGKTVGELRSMGAAGELTAQAVVKALQSQVGAVDALFDKTATTIGNSFTKIGNSLTHFVGELDQATGASNQIANAFVSVSKAIDGSLPGAISGVKNNSDALAQALTTGLLVALARVAGGYAQQGASALYAAQANQTALTASARTAKQDLWAAQAKQIDAKAMVARAELEIAAAQGKLASDRVRQTSELANLQAVQATLLAERNLEQQRLLAQISAKGRTLSIARLAELRLAEVATIKQVEIAERSLAATTSATSAQIQAGYAMRTAATLAYGETTAVVNAAVIASDRAAAAASVTARAFAGLRAAGAGLLTLMGGPLGLAFIAGAVALSFVDWSSKSQKLMGDLSDLKTTVDQLRQSFAGLNEDQQRAKISEWKDKQLGATLAVQDAYDDLETSIKSSMVSLSNVRSPEHSKQLKAFEELSTRLKEARANGQSLTPILDELASNPGVRPQAARNWTDLAGKVSDAQQVLDQTTERLDVLSNSLTRNTTETQLNTQAKAGMTAGGQKYLATLQSQLAKLQDNGDAVKEATRYIEEHTDLSESDRVAILSTGYALKAQAAANKVATQATKENTSAVKANQKAFDSTEEDYQRQIELINTTTDKQKNATEVSKLAFEITSGKLVGINALQQKRLEGLAVELDSLKQLKQANEDAAKLAAFGATLKDTNQTIRQGYRIELSGAGSGDKLKERLQADLEIQQEHDKQVSDLFKQRNAGDISKELYKQETELLSEALAERMVIQQDYYNQLDAAQSNWMDGVGDAWNNYLDQSRDISGQTKDMFTDAFSGMNDALYNFVTTGKLSFSDMAATFASSALKMLIQWGTAQVAMAALNAFTSTAAIPIVGPFAAPAAAASALGAAGSFMGMIGSVAGMAHDGIDAVPETGTWLLQKGERVTTAQTSAKLDRTLEQVAQGGGAGGKGLTVNLIEDRSRAGQSERGTNSDGSEYLNLWAAQIRSGGNEASDSLEAAYGLKRQAG
ncbi:phage tail tape measure protein [Pseudomonas deceptionensis]|uniref:Phage tail tape measure protein, lambda family n=1 Tax=Pseudomonas deceptionensis TaxID=882211 RepID=A0A1H5MSJ6_PSEDM|nr:phage tail tape measure protein [Pseudomonas deceptionensis]SEE91338.1 phage tail tape measure protein, lambda family [Pseudomonas deceptionensis]